MTKAEAIESMEYSKAQAEIALSKGVSQYWKQEINWTIEAIDMAIEALSEETSTIQEKHQLSEEIPTNTPTDAPTEARRKERG